MYNHSEIDKKWQDAWAAAGAFRAEDFSEKPKKYVLVEFPFPSAAGLHVGHPRSYVALDVLARKLRMQGNNVLYPMGWDAFGLPTENYALKTGRAPADVTAENVANFKRQIQSIGLSIDWSREINSTDPAYYKWTQWQFLQFFKAGLAYKAKTWINWCPKDKIGLANEEAAGGVCDRCGGPVEKREKEQWMIGITKYADRLLSDLDTVNYLPKIRKQQEEWIGRSEGAEVDFAIEGTADKKIRVFTTRPDTLFGVTYVTLAPEHELVKELIVAHDQEIGEQLPDSVERSAVRVMCVRDGKLLITYDKPMKEYILPGGGVDEGETPEQAALRELVEETGFKNAKIVKNLGTFKHNYYHVKLNKNFRSTETVFLVDIENDEQAARTEEEIVKTDFMWMPIAEVKEKLAATATVFSKAIEQVKHFERYLAVMEYLAAVSNKTEMERTDATREKTGVFTGRHAINPVNGERVPIWISDYVLAGYGTGAVMAVPAHDERDFEFAKKFGLPVKKVVLPPRIDSHYNSATKVIDDVRVEMKLWTDDGVATNSEFLDGLSTSEAKQKMIAWLEEKKVGARKVTYKLRDWVFSRQRYWGEPIPLVHCDSCAIKKQKVLMIHGFEGSAELNFFPYMKRELEARGFEVFAPTMTTSRHPDVEKWMEELMPFMDQLGEDDIVIGHSIGSKAAIHLVERAGKKIKNLFLIASRIAAIDERDWAMFKKEWGGNPDVDALRKFWEVPMNLERVNELAESVQLVWSDDDEWTPSVDHSMLPRGWFINLLHGFGHFDAEVIPELVDIVASAKITGWNPLPDSALPLTLPQIAKYEPTDTGESPLASIPEFVNTTCPRCGGAAKRETDTMPNWAGSSWYFLRYCDAHNDKEFAAMDKLKYWMPVDLYNGGMEHTTLHLLYSRFWNKFMFDLGYVPTAEPYARRVSHGLIMSEDGTKMSKSKGNVVNPDEIVREQGADTLRVYEMFIGPFSEPAPWSVSGVSGVKRFLDRVMRLDEKIADAESEEVTRGLHKMLKAVTEDYDRMSFNTAVAQYMTFANTVYSAGGITRDSLKLFVRALNVAAPHVSEEVWKKIGGEGLVCQQPWPQFDPALVHADTFELVVQVNGKVRDRISVATDTSDEDVQKIALASEKVQEWLGGKAPKKIVVIKNRLVSIAV